MLIQPLIGLICCRKDIQGQPGQAVHEKYIDAVTHAGGMPILLPQELNDCLHRERLFASLDGIVLTGSYSNVAPIHYRGAEYEEVLHEEVLTDLPRDKLSFHLLEHAMRNNKPLLAICRGHQEMNVFFGGSLMTDWRQSPKFTLPHLENSSLSLAEQYRDVHTIEIHSGGLLENFGTRAEVNSLHKQCIEKLAPGLFIEAMAPDGMIEAVSMPGHKFMLGVQWHPEYKSTQKPLSKYIFNRFIEKASEA